MVAQRQFIKEHGVGLVFKDMEELQEMLRDEELVNRMRGAVLRKRFEFTVERNIMKITDLYHHVAS